MFDTMHVYMPPKLSLCFNIKIVFLDKNIPIIKVTRRETAFSS